MVFWHIFLVIFLWVIFYNFYWKRRNLPPGPIPWPFVGSIPLLFWEKPGTGAEIFLRWRKKYGPIYCYWIGEIPIVTVNDYDAMIESFVKNPDVFTGKFTIPKMDKFFRGGTYGIVFTEGELWKEQRRFALQVFRNLGMGRNVIEEKILDEVSGMIECLTTDSQYDVCDLPWRFEVCVGSIINSLLFGYRFEGEKLKEFKFLKKLLSRHMRSIADPYTMMLVQDVDLLKHIFQKTYKKYEENRNHFFGFFNQQIEEHEKEIILDSIDEPTDYVEAFLRIMHENEKKGIKETNYTKQQLANMCLDLWFAGMETTANTLQFSVLFLIHNPKCVKLLQKELDQKINSDRLITLKDKPSLPYLQAVINESQRFSNLLPQNLLHKTLDDVEICGYKIQKNTIIVPQISCVLFDEKYFPKPYKFKPKRFLDENGQLKKIEQFIPFSVGKRQCLGESLAKTELFLILGNLYNQFEIHPENPDKLPSLNRFPGVTWQPTPYKVKITQRY